MSDVEFAHRTAGLYYGQVLSAVAVCGNEDGDGVVTVIKKACKLTAAERHTFAKCIADSAKLKASFIAAMQDFLSCKLDRENIDHRHFGSYLEICAAYGTEMFGKGKTFVEQSYKSVERSLPFWMKKKFEDLQIIYFANEKARHHGPSGKQLSKKSARAAHDRAVRNAMRGSGAGGGGGKQKRA